MDVGIIGTGAMGYPMATNLLRAGHRLHIYARRPHGVAPLLAGGAMLCPTPADLASRCGIVITMVTTAADVEEVLTGSDGVSSGAAPDTIVVDMSTIAPAAARRLAGTLAERDLRMLDAPVTGGPMGAANATLTIMVGGDLEVLARARPILECLGRQLIHVGGHGAGQTAKACNQLAILVNAEGAAEALALGTKLGLDPRALLQVLLGGIAASRVLEVFGERMATRNFEPGIPAQLYDKDLDIVLDLARGVGQAVPAAAAVRKHLDSVVRPRRGCKDLAALIEAVGDMAVGPALSSCGEEVPTPSRVLPRAGG